MNNNMPNVQKIEIKGEASQSFIHKSEIYFQAKGEWISTVTIFLTAI